MRERKCVCVRERDRVRVGETVCVCVCEEARDRSVVAPRVMKPRLMQQHWFTAWQAFNIQRSGRRVEDLRFRHPLSSVEGTNSTILITSELRMAQDKARIWP